MMGLPDGPPPPHVTVRAVTVTPSGATGAEGLAEVQAAAVAEANADSKVVGFPAMEEQEELKDKREMVRVNVENNQN